VRVPEVARISAVLPVVVRSTVQTNWAWPKRLIGTLVAIGDQLTPLLVETWMFAVGATAPPGIT